MATTSIIPQQFWTFICKEKPNIPPETALLQEKIADILSKVLLNPNPISYFTSIEQSITKIKENSDEKLSNLYEQLLAKFDSLASSDSSKKDLLYKVFITLLLDDALHSSELAKQLLDELTNHNFVKNNLDDLLSYRLFCTKEREKDHYLSAVGKFLDSFEENIIREIAEEGFPTAIKYLIDQYPLSEEELQKFERIEKWNKIEYPSLTEALDNVQKGYNKANSSLIERTKRGYPHARKLLIERLFWHGNHLNLDISDFLKKLEDENVQVYQSILAEAYASDLSIPGAPLPPHEKVNKLWKLAINGNEVAQTLYVQHASCTNENLEDLAKLGNEAAHTTLFQLRYNTDKKDSLENTINHLTEKGNLSLENYLTTNTFSKELREFYTWSFRSLRLFREILVTT